jgi:hypothetical protein
MDTQVEILEDTVLWLLAIVNSIDRTKSEMVDTYPNWDEQDTAEFKTLIINRLNYSIAKIQQL